MRFFRQLIRQRKLAGLLLFGILLRSLIASGFMLDASPADGSLLSIKLCDGPITISSTLSLDGELSHHHAHDQTEHGSYSEDHGFSACSFWSSSSQSILADNALIDFTDISLADEIVIYQSKTPYKNFHQTRLARAPPALT